MFKTPVTPFMGEKIRDTDSHVYNSHEVLGRGATGEVYKGINKRTGEVVALKIFDQRFSQQVQREVEALVNLQHPNIVKFFRCEKDYDTKKTVLVMELCEKGSLLDMLKQPENAYGVDEDEFLKVFEHLVAGVKHLRSKGFSHRDIKPGNILVFTDEDGSNVYKLSDFGTAKPLGDKDMFQSLVGTEEYLHPKIFRAAFIDNKNGRTFDISADMWSLGVTLYHVATGRVPFHAYQGRFDRETMYHEILAKKPEGALSGQQLERNGKIEWSTELPRECRLSIPLKKRLTSMLVQMFANKPDWGFEQFFDETDKVLEMRTLHVFSSHNGHIYTLFLDKDATYKELQTEVSDYMGVVKEDQMLLFETRDLSDTVSPDTGVVHYPRTSRKEPFVLVSKTTDIQQTRLFKLAGFENILPEKKLKFGEKVQVEDDYITAKIMHETIHLTSRLVHDAVLSQWLFWRTITRHGRKFDDQIHRHQRDFDFLNERFDDVTSLTDGDTKVPTNEYARVSKDGDIVDDDFENVKMKMLSCGKQLKTLKDEYEAAKESWTIEESVILQNEQWEGKAKRLVSLSAARMTKFKDFRSKIDLSFHEKQLFSFDRKAMTELQTKSSEVFEDCLHCLKETHVKFIIWHSHFTKFSRVSKEIEIKIEDVRTCIGELVETMKGVPEPLPPPQKPTSLKQKLLAQDVKHSVEGFGKQMTESQTFAVEARDTIQSMTELLQDLPVPLVDDMT